MSRAENVALLVVMTSSKQRRVGDNLGGCCIGIEADKKIDAAGFGFGAERRHRGPTMAGWRQLETERRKRPGLDNSVMSGERKMLGGNRAPGQPQRFKILARADQWPVQRHAVVTAHSACLIAQGNALRTKLRRLDHPQRVHDVDVRIAGFVMIDPVGNHAFGGELRADKRAHQINVLRASIQAAAQ